MQWVGSVPRVAQVALEDSSTMYELQGAANTDIDIEDLRQRPGCHDVAAVYPYSDSLSLGSGFCCPGIRPKDNPLSSNSKNVARANLLPVRARQMPKQGDHGTMEGAGCGSREAAVHQR